MMNVVLTYSSAQALPPRISKTRRVCSRALPQLLRFTMLIISGVALPASFNLPTYTYVSKRSLSYQKGTDLQTRV